MEEINWDVQNNFTFENPNFVAEVDPNKYIFKSAFHTFQAIINPKIGTIKIGGLYDNCLNLTIDYDSDYAKIGFIESEPECALDSLLEDGQGSEMVKASLQFVNSLFPHITKFHLDDMSQIECGMKSKNGFPPRKKQVPFSLPYLSIATNGKTWYEKYFNATLNDSELYEQYKQGLKPLSYPIKERYHTFDVFAKRFSLSEKTRQILEPLFDPEKSWHAFFQSVPLKLRCTAFYNWLPTCIILLTNNAFVTNDWVIDITIMPKTTMEILPTSNIASYTVKNNTISGTGTRKNGGGGKKMARRRYVRNTRKAKDTRVFFSHKRYHNIM